MLRKTLYRQLAPEGWQAYGLSPVNKLVCVLILVASFVAILETEDSIRDSLPWAFSGLEVLFVALFSVEYLARLYAAGEDPRYRGWQGRVRYVFTWWALVDLIAILPFFLGFITHNTFMIRLLKVCRLLRLSRLGRFSRA